MSCVIIANGEFCTHKIPLKILKKANFVIACDGAANSLLIIKKRPNIIIGDLDSFEKYDENIKIIKKNNQSTNDLTKAIKYALYKNFSNITILGAGGKRDDHFIANFALLFQYYGLKNRSKNKIKLKMITNYGEFLISDENIKISSFKGQQISLFCMDSKARFSSNGLKFKLDNLRLKFLNEGTLNESLGKNFEIINHDKVKIIIYKSFCK